MLAALPLLDSPIHEDTAIGENLGIKLLIKRDDLLPFPLAGNKVRKLQAEMKVLPSGTDTLVTNGAIVSNHCRTTAFIAAERGLKAHLVLHGSLGTHDDDGQLSRDLYTALGASFEIVAPSEINSALAVAADRLRTAGRVPHIIPGGCHTIAAVRSYSEAAEALSQEHPHIDVIVVASGTGATQAGIIDGTLDRFGGAPRVVGISVARGNRVGRAGVAEALEWIRPGAPVDIEFDDRFVDGGYGLAGSTTRRAAALAWRHGLPVDTTYTGKAFAGLCALLQSGAIPPTAHVLFWHTGGLLNQLEKWRGQGSAPI